MSNIKNWISFIKEGKIEMDKHTFNKICSEEHLDKYFNITLDDIQDIVQDVLDDNTYLSCCINIWDENKFVIKFYIDSDILNINNHGINSTKFKRYSVLKYIDNISKSLESFNLKITYITNPEDDINSHSFGLNIFVSNLDTL